MPECNHWRSCNVHFFKQMNQFYWQLSASNVILKYISLLNACRIFDYSWLFIFRCLLTLVVFILVSSKKLEKHLFLKVGTQRCTYSHSSWNVENESYSLLKTVWNRGHQKVKLYPDYKQFGNKNIFNKKKIIFNIIPYLCWIRKKIIFGECPNGL